jgi:hypothetical protein
MPKAGGKWNTFEITAKGPQLTVVLNGTKTVDMQDSKFAGFPMVFLRLLPAGDPPMTRDAPAVWQQAFDARLAWPHLR